MPSEVHEITCIANITRQYFAEAKSVVYLSRNAETNKLLRTLHSMEVISLDSGSSDVVNPYLAYITIYQNARELLEMPLELIRETNWNPYARILAVFKFLRPDELRQVFDMFLRIRASNVVVLNGTSTTELYTYNPYENFACGSYYSRIIYFGKCSDVTADIYPKKTITGLKNCFFRVSVPHWPPWGINPSVINPSVIKSGPDVIGTEQYIFHLLSEIEQFKYKFFFDYDPEAFSTVSKNLSITGPMIRLAENKSDFMLGGLMLIPSRANVFSFISGHVDYLEEIRIIVKRAGNAPAWKNFYLEFSESVWALLIFSLIIYSAVVALLLKTKDKGRIILVLLDSLLTHGAQFRSRQSVKSVIIVWVVFAALVNSYYTTILMSLTTRPSKDYQIHDEPTVIRRQLEPCISSVMGTYMQSEQNHGEILKDVKFATPGCVTLIDSIKTVSGSHRRFSIVLQTILNSFDNTKFYKQADHSPLFLFTRPYTKVIYAIYFNKGLPMKSRLSLLAIRIRETGLSEKHLRDVSYNQTLYNLWKRDKKFNASVSRVVSNSFLPWHLYGFGLLVSTISFMVELASPYNTVQIASIDK